MTTRLKGPLVRRVGDVVVELSEAGITLRFRGCRRKHGVFLSYDDAIEVAIDRAGYRPAGARTGDPATERPAVEQLKNLRRYRREQPRTLFSSPPPIRNAGRDGPAPSFDGRHGARAPPGVTLSER